MMLFAARAALGPTKACLSVNSFSCPDPYPSVTMIGIRT